MSAECCKQEPETFSGASSAYRRALWIVIAINAGMFLVEMTAGALAGSKALQADALDFAADSATYGLSLAAIGWTLLARARVALFKGISLAVMAAVVFGFTAYEFFGSTIPNEETMGIVGFMALSANVISALLLMRYRDGDANVRSVWLCTRNDAIGNVAVMLAAFAVAVLNSRWPDLIVATGMALLFLSSSISIIRHARREVAEVKAAAARAIPNGDGTCV